MKKILLMSAALAAMIFTSCSKENDVDKPDPVAGADIAYVSIRVESQESRAGSSSEDDALPENPEESDIKSLYLITFTDANDVVAVPGSGTFHTVINTTSKTPDAVEISASSKKLIVIANPGDKLKTAITGLHSRSTFATFNAAITAATTADIVSPANGFAMITAGDEAGKAAGSTILDPFVEIGTKLHVVTDVNPGPIAKAAAEADRLPVKLERYAAKLMVKKGTVTVTTNATFDLTHWTVDAVNGSYYPFAEKTLMAGHTAGDYTNAFYTKDPNYTNNAGLVYGTVNASFTQVLPWTSPENPNGYYGWKAPVTDIAYVIENTMDANAQMFANATRIVLKATYFPETYTVGDDWFSWAGTTYPSLTALQTAYAAVDATTALKDACERFFGGIKDYYTISGQIASLNAGDFETLTQAELDAVTPGGQVVKEGTDPVVLWYKGGVCYYYYEIRHDNDPDAANMAFAKYGVVRNNWYNLKLNSVSGPGTPWYPDVNDPGPGDPGTNDPIDKQKGYLGVSIEIAPWIVREGNIDI